MTDIGARLKQARQDAGLTQREVARRFDVTIGSIQAWEYEKAQLNLRRAIELCDLYGITLEWLAYGGPQPHTEDPTLKRIKALLESAQ